MLDQLLRERLSQNEYRVYNACLILIGLWIAYGLFDNSGLPGLFTQIQANFLFNGSYYPLMSFIISFALVVLALGGLFLLYARMRGENGNVNEEA